LAGASPPPPVPTDFDADRHYPKAEMDVARGILRREHGQMSWSKVDLEQLEWRPGGGPDAYAWEGRASFGGDIHRFVLKSEGEGADHLEDAEVQALYSRAIAPFFDLQAGVRQDFEPRGTSYAVLGLDGVAPTWFELEAAIFLSHRGDLTARFEGAYDFRLTQRLILEPRLEANLSAQHVPELQLGSGLSDVELGLRLRYAVTPFVAPYVGVHYERKFGDTADLARAAGEDVGDTRWVVGLRAWF
jgi:copper resistance protein B